MTAFLLIVTVLLLIANGFFVAAEFALTAARRSKMEHLAQAGNARAKVALSSIRELSLMLAGAQLGITMASLGLGYVSEPAIAHLVEAGLHSVVELSPGVLHSISFVIALMLVVFLHMVVGEMAPKNIAIADPEKSALWIAVPFRAFVNLFRPFIHLLNFLANAALRLFKVEPRDQLHSGLTAEDIGGLISQSGKEGVLDRFDYRLLSGVILFTDLDAAAVMVARTELTAVPLSATAADIERAAMQSGHSRFPVYAENLDQIVGFFHAKDLLRIDRTDYDRPIPRTFIRKMLLVPETRKLQPLLLDMRRQRSHFALVIDEHGGTAGVVAIEDLIEELVGEIRDEYDETEAGIERLSDRQFLVPGSLRIDEAADRLGVSLPKGEYDTLAGFLMDKLQRIPKRRDVVEHAGWRLRVRTMHRRRVVQILIEKVDAPAGATAGSRLV